MGWRLNLQLPPWLPICDNGATSMAEHRKCTAMRGPQAGERRSDPDGISGSATAAAVSHRLTHDSNDENTSDGEDTSSEASDAADMSIHEGFCMIEVEAAMASSWKVVRQTQANENFALAFISFYESVKDAGRAVATAWRQTRNIPMNELGLEASYACSVHDGSVEAQRRAKQRHARSTDWPQSHPLPRKPPRCTNQTKKQNGVLGEVRKENFRNYLIKGMRACSSNPNIGNNSDNNSISSNLTPRDHEVLVCNWCGDGTYNCPCRHCGVRFCTECMSNGWTYGINCGCAEGNIIPGWTRIPPPRGPVPTYPQAETTPLYTKSRHVEAVSLDAVALEDFVYKSQAQSQVFAALQWVAKDLQITLPTDDVMAPSSRAKSICGQSQTQRRSVPFR